MFRRIVLGLLATGVLAGGPEALAHIPHDHVHDVEVSPAYSLDGTVFAVIRRRLYRSTDGGDSWQRLSRGLGSCPHWLNALEISPTYSTDRTLFVSCRRAGVYRSRDAGQTWQGKLLAEEDIVSMVASPGFADDGTLLARGEHGKAFRTTDAGQSWQRVLEQAGPVTTIGWGGNVAVAGSGEGVLHISQDGGGQWREYGRLPESVGVTAIALPRDFALGQAFFIGTDGAGVYRVHGEGTFEQRSGQLAREHITALATLVQKGVATQLAATFHEAVFRSEDEGETWQHSAEGLLKHEQADVYGLPHFTRLVAPDDDVVFLAGFSGLFRSEDGGRSWAWLQPTMHHVVGLDVGAHSDTGQTVGISTYGSGVYSTRDEGLTWRAHNVALPNTRTGPVAFSPDFARDRTLFTATFDTVLRSTDGAATWSAAALQPGGLRRLKARIVEFFSSEGARSPSFNYYVPTQENDLMPLVLAVSPDFSEDQTVFAGMFPNGVIRSVDGGRSFTLIWGALGSPVGALALSPEYASDRTLFAAAWGGLFRSVDGGDSWQRIAADVDFDQVHPGKSVLALSPGFGQDDTLYVGTGTGLLRSRDRGRTFQELPLPDPDGGLPVTALAVSPSFASDHRLLVQVEGGGFYVCRDQGGRFEATATTLTQKGYELTQVFKREGAPLIRFSPHYAADATVYAASFRQLLRSTDGGMSWQELPSYPTRFDVDLSYGRIVAILPTEFNGDWRVEKGVEYSNRQLVYATRAGSRATLRFVGTGVRWLGTRGPDRGVAQVFVDGALRTKVDQYAKQRENLVMLHSVAGLASGSHTITIEVDATRHEDSSGSRVDIDALEVTRGESRQGERAAPGSGAGETDSPAAKH